MKKINVLSKKISQLIAAGEVVERPVSVLKELLENSIDSGATRITVEIKNGGVKLIKVTDNGSGIYHDDVKNAFLRHATSKLSSAEDLNSINSLGFRGEALASVCAVSKTEIITKTKDEAEGTHYFINGGVPSTFEFIGCCEGTVIFVRDIFYNVPARMKFLKKDVAEGNACAGIIDKLALSHPEIAFKFIRDGKLVLNTPGDGKIYSAMYCVYGKDFAENMIKVDYELNGIKVSGFVGKPIYSKPTKSMQHFFVNGRYVKSKLGSSALDEAFKNSVMVGKFPYCVIYLEISPELVDVNVHPTKTEVKFANDKNVFEGVYYAVKSALMKGDESKVSAFNTRLSDSARENILNNSKEIFDNSKMIQQNRDLIKKLVTPAVAVTSLEEDTNLKSAEQPKKEVPSKISFSGLPASKPIVLETDKKISEEKEKLNLPKTTVSDEPKMAESTFAFKPTEEVLNVYKRFQDISEEKVNIIGEIFKCYIIIEYEEKMILVDKHAAHERIIFEKLKKSEIGVDSQILLEPKIIQMEKNEYGAIIENREMLLKAGFDVDDFGGGSIIVRSAPMYIEPCEIEDVVLEISGYILNNKMNLDNKKLDWLYHNIACRAAVKAGNKSSKEEIASLVRTLSENPNVKYCPHGRPIFVDFSKRFIEKQFGRV